GVEGAMILGMSIEVFTTFHVILSLIGIVSGLVMLIAMARGHWLSAWNGVFLITTVATSVTGFLFPISAMTPAIVFGILSLAVLAVALLALFVGRLAGAWRPVYVVSAAFALYLNTFVGVVQSFQKVPLLQPLAPTQSEPPFLGTQLVLLILFVVAGVLA